MLRITRLGVNFGDIPVNRPVCPFATTQQDGHMQLFSKKNRTRYHPNRFDAVPVVPDNKPAYRPYPEVMAGVKERMHGPKFNEFYKQAQLFLNSMSGPERKHMISAVQFELSKCFETEVQQAAIDRLNMIDHDFAVACAEVLASVKVPDEVNPNEGKKSAFLSMVDSKTQSEHCQSRPSETLMIPAFTAEGRKVGIYVLPGFEYTQIATAKMAFEAAGMMAKVVSAVYD